MMWRREELGITRKVRVFEVGKAWRRHHAPSKLPSATSIRGRPTS
jgi:hypothetical protein